MSSDLGMKGGSFGIIPNFWQGSSLNDFLRRVILRALSHKKRSNKIAGKSRNRNSNTQDPYKSKSHLLNMYWRRSHDILLP